MSDWLVRIGLRAITWVLCVGVAVGLALAWTGSVRFADVRMDRYVTQQREEARSDVLLISSNLNQRVEQARSIGQTLTLDQDFVTELARFGPDIQVSTLKQPERASVWLADPALQKISQRMTRIVERFGLTTLWMTNAAGDTIAEGHALGMTPFVGTNYVDRDYFKAAQQGLTGRQFAIGRATNVYGLFFSAPVLIDGQFVGMVGTALSVPRLSPIIEQVNAVVTDDLGVIVLAKDPALLMQTMPGATVNTLSAEAREKRYKRTHFAPADISPVSLDGKHALYRWRNEPSLIIMESQSTEDGSLRVYSLRELGETFANRRSDQLWWFGLVSLLVLVTALLFAVTAKFLIKTRSQQVELVHLNEALALEAHTDALTGCANRRHFMQLLAQERDRSKRYNGDMCLLSLDIDHFKRVNDTYGHAGGDEVLKHFVATIQSHLRQVDTLGRVGGEEFSILLPQTSAASGALMAERIRASVEAAPAVFGSVNIAITVSVGGVQWQPDSDLPLDRLLAIADAALYDAKSGGRNRVVWASPQDSAHYPGTLGAAAPA